VNRRSRTHTITAISLMAGAAVIGPALVVALDLAIKQDVLSRVLIRLGDAPVERAANIVVLIAVSGSVVLSNRGRKKRIQGSSRVPWKMLVVLLGFVVTGLVLLNIMAVDDRIAPIVPRFGFAAVATAVVLGVCLPTAVHWYAACRGARRRLVHSAIALGVLGCLAIYALPLVQVNGGILDMYDTMFVSNEIGAVTAGRLPGWDFISQYTTLLPYASALFSVILRQPLQVALPLFLTSVSFGVLAAVMWMLRRSGASRTAAALLMVPVVATWTYSVAPTYWGVPSYWAVGPVRLTVLVPLIFGLYVISSSRCRENVQAIAVGACCFSALALNVDWGLAAVAALLFMSGRLARGTLGRQAMVAAKAAVILLILIAAVAIAQLALEAPAGVLNSTAFVRWAAIQQGLQAAVLRPFGMQWIMVGTFLAAAYLGSWPVARIPLIASRALQMQRASLGGLGVFGAFAMSYFFLRPYATTAVAIYPVWGVTCAVLLIFAISQYKSSPSRNERMLLAGLVVLAVLPVMTMFYPTPVSFSIARLTEQQTARSMEPSALVRLAVMDLGGGPHGVAPSKVGIVSAFMAIDASAVGAQEGLPFNHPGYVHVPQFATVACTWLRGRFDAVVTVAADLTPLVYSTLSCSGYLKVGTHSSGDGYVNVWRPEPWNRQ
jgi:hypothetical protein